VPGGGRAGRRSGGDGGRGRGESMIGGRIGDVMRAARALGLEAHGRGLDRWVINRGGGYLGVLVWVREPERYQGFQPGFGLIAEGELGLRAGRLPYREAADACQRPARSDRKADLLLDPRRSAYSDLGESPASVAQPEGSDT